MVMKVETFNYQERWPSPINALGEIERRGCLLRVRFDDGGIGFADFHPFPQKHLANQLEPDLQSPQGQWSLKMARFDAEARSQGRSCFDQGESQFVPNSHLLINANRSLDDQIAPSAKGVARVVKIKIGLNLESEQRWLKSNRDEIKQQGWRLRLDANSKLSQGEWIKWQNFLEPFLGQIDFIEDPIPWDLLSWRDSSLPLALDLEADRVLAEDYSQLNFLEAIVVKPALGELAILNHFSGRKVFTHLMDHPLGQRAALAWVTHLGRAHLIDESEVHGLNAFTYPSLNAAWAESPWLETSGSRRSTGFGFDELLDQLPWREIRFE